MSIKIKIRLVFPPKGQQETHEQDMLEDVCECCGVKLMAVREHWF
jgi:hypothetical protein